MFIVWECASKSVLEKAEIGLTVHTSYGRRVVYAGMPKPKAPAMPQFSAPVDKFHQFSRSKLEDETKDKGSPADEDMEEEEEGDSL